MAGIHLNDLPSFWAIEVPILKVISLKSCVSSWGRTSPYHAKTNRWVEWAHQTLMCMIGKLSKDQKVDWPKHLPVLVHAYNSTISAITGCSPHYLKFRCQLCLPIDVYFPMIRGMEKHWCVNYYIAELHEWLWEAFKDAQEQSTAEAKRQKQY